MSVQAVYVWKPDYAPNCMGLFESLYLQILRPTPERHIFSEYIVLQSLFKTSQTISRIYSRFTTLILDRPKFGETD